MLINITSASEKSKDEIVDCDDVLSGLSTTLVYSVT